MDKDFALAYARLFGEWIARQQPSGHELHELMEAVEEGRTAGDHDGLISIPVPMPDFVKGRGFVEDGMHLQVVYDGDFPGLDFPVPSGAKKAFSATIRRGEDGFRINMFQEGTDYLGRLRLGFEGKIDWLDVETEERDGSDGR